MNYGVLSSDGVWSVECVFRTLNARCVALLVVCVMARGPAPPCELVACRSLLLLWLLSGLVDGFIVSAPRISLSGDEHAAQNGGGGAGQASRGTAVTTTFPRRKRCIAVTAAPAAANDVIPEEQVRHTALCTNPLKVELLRGVLLLCRECQSYHLGHHVLLYL